MRSQIKSWATYRALVIVLASVGLAAVLCFTAGLDTLGRAMTAAVLTGLPLQVHLTLRWSMSTSERRARLLHSDLEELRGAVAASARAQLPTYQRLATVPEQLQAAAGLSGQLRDEMIDLRRELLATESEIVARLGETAFSAAQDVRHGVADEMSRLRSYLAESCREQESHLRGLLGDIALETHGMGEYIDRYGQAMGQVVARLSSLENEIQTARAAEGDRDQLLRSVAMTVGSRMEFDLQERIAQTLEGLSAVATATVGLESAVHDLRRATERGFSDHAFDVSAARSHLAKMSEGGEKLASQIDEISAAVANGSIKLERAIAELSDACETSDSVAKTQFDLIQSKFLSVRTSLEELPQSASEYLLLRQSLLTDESEAPPIGGWALSAPTVTAIARRILTGDAPQSVMELGSGASTVWSALALRARGHGHCITLEHLPEYATRTRNELARRGLTEWATVIDAPLREIEMNGEKFQWYSIDDLPSDLRIDILLVDGPPGDIGRAARYPAFPMLAERLNNGAWIVLDDTIRTDEKRIAASWKDNETPHGSISGIRSTGKSTIMTFARAGS